MTTTTAFESTGYGTGLTLDLFRPTAGQRHCAVLVLHGGGWRAGSRDIVHTRAEALAARGFTALAVQYRLLDEAPWPAPLADAAAALSWTRDNAGQLDIDPAHVVVQGHSAGGHIALMSGTLPAEQRPAAIAAYYPAIGFHPVDPPTPPALPFPLELDELGRVPSWMLFPPGTAQAELDAASPITLLDADFPPTVVLHGTADSAVDTRSSVALHRRLGELGVLTDLHLYGDRDHEFDRAPSLLGPTSDAVAQFLDRALLCRAELDAEARRYGFPPAADA